MLVATLSGMAPPAVCQDESPSERTFFAPVEVSVINVEVLVTDRRGRPVADLTSGDFEVFEDGEPVGITHFHAAPGVISKGASSTAPISPEAEADQDLYLTVVFVDNHLSVANKRRSLEVLGAFLPQIPANSYVMMARCTGQLQIIQPFTNDRKKLQDALQKLGTLGSTDLSGEADRIRREMQTLAEQNPPSGSSALPDDRRLRPLEMSDFSSASALNYIQHIKAYSAAAKAQTEETFVQLQQVIRSVAGLHGRRVVLVISDGIESNPGAELFNEWEQIFSYVATATNINPSLEAQQFDLTVPLTEMAQTANADRITVHAITTKGRGLTASSGADREGGVTIGTGLETEGQLRPRQADVFLSEVTGGRMMVNDRKLGRQMSALAEELGSYYSLGYRPTHGGDGDYHRIRVTVRGDRLSIRHRDGYEDVRGAGRIADRTLTAAVLGLTENPLGVSVDCREQEPREEGLYLVPVVVRVPLSQLSMLPQPAEHEGKVSIIIVVRDQQGGLAEMERREYPIKIPHEQFLSALQDHAEFIMGLLMRPGSQRIAVGVRDELGNVDSTLTVDVNVGEIAL